MAKAAPWTKTDAQVRKRGEQTGLDTLVVHAVNDVDLEVVCSPGRKGHDDLTSSPPSSSLSLAVSFEFPAGPLATKDKGCARCGT